MNGSIFSAKMKKWKEKILENLLIKSQHQKAKKLNLMIKELLNFWMILIKIKKVILIEKNLLIFI